MELYLLDDSLDELDLFEYVLKKINPTYELKKWSSVFDFMASVQSEISAYPDFVFVDLNLSGNYAGVEIVRYLKKIQFPTQCVLYSSSPAIEEFNFSFEDVCYFRKPIALANFRESLKLLLKDPSIYYVPGSCSMSHK